MTLLADFTIYGQVFAASDLVIIAILVVLEGVLSIDNALVLGILAKRLPKFEQKRALTYGLVGAFVFRILAVCTASFLLQWTIAKFLGGAYLVYIAVKHLFFESHEKEDSKIELDASGHPKLVDSADGGPASMEAEETELRERQPLYLDPETRKKLGLAAFWPTVAIIELTDVAFAVDSILAALAFVGSPPKGHPPEAYHPKLWLVVAGGILGVMLMRVAAVFFIKLLEKFPRFELTAYLLVIVIGVKLLADWGFNSNWSFDSSPAMAQRLGTWKESFEGMEAGRRELVHDYDAWLKAKWPLPVKTEADHAGETAHTPHLLDFHSITRPESLVFWLAMAVCFAIGFTPKRKSESHSVPLGEQSA